jgi:YVTN family beta-propeller protein
MKSEAVLFLTSDLGHLPSFPIFAFRFSIFPIQSFLFLLHLNTMKKINHITCAIAALFLATLSFYCQAQSKNYLLALSKSDHTLAIVDPVSLKILSKVPVGEDPHEVIASADGKTAYVTVYGGGSLHTINIIDLVAQKPLPDLDTKPLYGPHDIVYTDNKVWFTAEGSKAVGRYDPAAGKIEWSMGTGQDRTHMLHVTDDTKNIYTININSGTVSILSNTPAQNGRENWSQTLIPVARGSEGFDVTPDGKYLWTVSGQDGSISIIDLAAKKAEAPIDAKLLGANRLKFTKDGKYALIASLRLGQLTVYDVATRKEWKKIDIGRGAAGILITPDNKRAFVACSPDNYISVIDLTTWQVTGKLEIGRNPDGLAWATQK